MSFIFQCSSGVELSLFPRLLFNVLHSSVRRGLADDGTRFQIPFQVAKEVGRFGLGAEFGPLISSVGPGELIYGVIAGTEVTKTTSIMAEVHATSRMDLSRDVVALNVGWRHLLSDHAIWIGSVGHEIHSGRPAAARLNRLLWRSTGLLRGE